MISAGLVDRERRLRDVGELRVRPRTSSRATSSTDSTSTIESGASPIVPTTSSWPCVADQDDGVPVGGVAPRLHVHLGDERARGVDRVQLARAGVRVHRRRDAVRREDDRLALGHLGLLVDEHGAARLEVADDVQVVDDLLAHVDGRPVQVECRSTVSTARSTPAQ